MANGREEKSKIEELNKHLNSRSFSPKTERESFRNYRRETEGIKRDWSSEGEGNNISNQNLEYQMAKKSRRFLSIFLTGSIAFFVLALALAAFIIFGGSNIISSDNVEISVSGPVSISGGEILSIDIIVSNNNNTALELSDLIIEYPEGTRSHENLSVELPRQRFSLGNIPAGQKVNQEVNAILFGEEGSREKIKMTVEYRVAGSNAIFFKEREYEIEISSSPISFRIESLRDVNSGKEVSLDITLKSNSNNLLENLMFIAEYPFGFTFKESLPRTSFEQNIWRLGDLSPGEEREIRIIGTLEGQDGEERVFRFFSGIQSDSNEKELETAFVSSTRSIFIKKPFLALDIILDGDTSENYNTLVGETVDVDILWENNLPTSVANVEIEALLSGEFDESSVFVQNGFYNSSNNTITWDQGNNPVFESINPGQDGITRFTFSSLEFTGSSLINPEAVIDVSVRGRRLSESNVSEEVVSSVTRKIRFNTNLSLVPKIVHFSGPISNSGPVPPKVETETTYSVIWTLSNTVNNASNVTVSARLPAYVRWTGQTSSNGENINYNSVSREVTWDVGSISNGSGFSSAVREVAFQLSFLPSVSQVGTAPILVEKVKISGKDDFTGSVIESIKGELTTKASTDPSYKAGDDKVVE